MLTRVQIKNFKSIGEGPNGGPGVDIELKPLTFFVGPNGGGKSSILEAIAVAIQGSHAGPFTNYPDRLSLIHRRDPNRQGQIIIHGIETRALLDGEDIASNESARAWGYEFSQSGYSYFDMLNGKVDRNADRNAITVAQMLRQSTFFISAVRGLIPPEPPASGSIGWVGVQGENIPQIIAHLFGSRKFDEQTLEIVSALEPFGITKLKGGWNQSGRLNLDYVDRDLKGVLIAFAASQGGRQVLAPIVQVILNETGSLTMIEEPEISLHPEAQVAMCHFLATHAAKGKQIIATTHSPFMIMALRRPIMESIIPAAEVAVYHVERNHDRALGEIGATIANLLPLNPEGFLEGWIPSFSKVETELLKDWALTQRDSELQEKPVNKRRRKSA